MAKKSKYLPRNCMKGVSYAIINGFRKYLAAFPARLCGHGAPTVYRKLKLKLASSEKLERFAKPKYCCDSIDLAPAETVSFAKEKAIASS